MADKEKVDELTLVYSRNHNEFLNFCRENGFDRRERNIREVVGIESLRGIHSAHVVRWGTWYERSGKDVDEILAYLEMLEKEPPQ